jgi:hypothetical protein
MRDFPGSLVEHAKDALFNEKAGREMEVCAFELFNLRYTWLHTAEKVIKYIKEVNIQKI